MQFSRIFLNRLQDQIDHHDTVVVIDVLRSFTTSAIALAQGARAIYPVDTVSAARTLAKVMPRAVTVGAVGGGDPISGFDFGNSPAALAEARLRGRDVILTTAAGVQGLQRFRHTRALYAASLICAKATADAIRDSGANAVSFVITGEWVDRDGDEDIACADYIEALLCGEKPLRRNFSRRVRESDFGQRFAGGQNPNLPLADLQWAVQVDKFEFAMPVHREGNQLVIRRPK